MANPKRTSHFQVTGKFNGAVGRCGFSIHPLPARESEDGSSYVSSDPVVVVRPLRSRESVTVSLSRLCEILWARRGDI